MFRWVLAVVAIVSFACSFACVRRSTYDARTADWKQCAGILGYCGSELQSAEYLAEENARRADDARAVLDARTERANQDLADLQRTLDDATALNASLRVELERMGANVDKLLAEKGAIASSLEAAKARLEELRRAQMAAERRVEQTRQLVERFRKMADAGHLRVAVRRGRMVLQLPNDVLFDSGKSAIRSSGKTTLERVAAILRTIPDRQFQIAGHTDNAPIRSSAFPSNWYLSTSRAITVVEVLVDAGVSPKVLSACGYGEFDPIVANDTAANKARNRRIEIVIQPNVDELLAAGSEPGW